MRAAALRSILDSRFATGLDWRKRPAAEVFPCGVREVDELAGGFPRGAITEIFGPASSGRTSLLHAVLAEATSRQEVCALVDVDDAFDPATAGEGGVGLEALLWVRCGGNAEHALKVTDLLLQGGGFGLVAIDLGDTQPEIARRIPLASWFRFRRAVENTRTVFVVVGQMSYAGTCASLSLETGREAIEWSGVPEISHLLRGLRLQVKRRKPVASATAAFGAKAAGA